jgi:DNA-binding HxlR family transcriptional regulator
MSVVGDRWTMLVLRQVFSGTRRFNDFERQLGLSSRTLADRLDRLVEDGVLVRQASDARVDQHVYRLTDKGRDLYPILLAMFRWGDKWMAGAYGPPIVFRHDACGHDVLADPACPHCHEPITARSVVPEAGPGLSASG